jgi:rhodanese-related sulfurtransferase
MPKHRTSSHRSSHRSSRKSSATFKSIIRRPIVQIGILVLAAVLIYLISSTANKEITSGGLPAEVDVDTAYSMYKEGVFVLDVRTLEEWNEFHVPGTTLIPLDELAAHTEELPRYRQIVVVCRSGNRSQQGRDILLEAGFTHVTSMSGGLNEWKTAGYPIEP